MRAAMNAVAMHRDAIRNLDVDISTLSKDAAMKSGKTGKLPFFPGTGQAT
jgi:hypothetical protein